jgi:Fe-S cluster assembly protein SufD
MLIDKNYYFKRFKKPVNNIFIYNSNLKQSRKDYISLLKLPFLLINQSTKLTINEEFAFILLDNSDLIIDGNFKTLIIEDISTKNNQIEITSYYNSKIIFINNAQTTLSVEKNILINNFHELNLYLTTIKKNTFIKNNLLINLLNDSKLEAHVFINTLSEQLFDLTTEIVHKKSNTFSHINFIGLNEGKLVSQINSIVESDSKDCESHQNIKHILFNKEAISYSKPSLMIFSPCVASHANSIGTIPDDWLFYLQTRGISFEQSLNIIKKSLTKNFIDKLNLSYIEYILEY